MRQLVILLFVKTAVTTALGQGLDLAKKYPATLDASDKPVGHVCVCEKEDVYLLKSFMLDWGEALKIEFGASTVAFGRSGTNVLWAVVNPDDPVTLRSSKAGNGDTIESVWLRFHPARLADLFPPRTVDCCITDRKRGVFAHPLNDDPRLPAKRIAAWKMNGSWQANNLPMVPTRDSIIVDIDTTARKRRFFGRDKADGEVNYVAAFENRALPKTVQIAAETAQSAFDEIWSAYDKEYAMFGIRDGVDWDKLRETYRPLTSYATTSYQLAAVLAEMLAHLKDLHIWVRAGDEFVPVFNRPRPLNASWSACGKLIGKLESPRGDLAWGRTPEGIGYVNIFRLNDQNLPALFDGVLEKLADTWAIVIDLRFNGGGGEDLAQPIAGRFVDTAKIYSLNQYRSGEKHDELGPTMERIVEPGNKWLYRGKLVVLIGQKTMSSAESFALMLTQAPGAMLMGDRTAGASGNPRIVELPADIKVSLPRWLDMRPDGVPLEKEGVVPTTKIDAKSEAFTDDADPVLEAALKLLRETSKEKRLAGKRD